MRRGGFRLVEDHFLRFYARIEEAAMESLAEAGHEGARVAGETFEHDRTGATRRSISWRIRERLLELTVGTFQGVHIERGTGERAGRGRVQASPFMEPGMRVSLSLVLPAIRGRMRRPRL